MCDKRCGGKLKGLFLMNEGVADAKRILDRRGIRQRRWEDSKGTRVRGYFAGSTEYLPRFSCGVLEVYGAGMAGSGRTWGKPHGHEPHAATGCRPDSSRKSLEALATRTPRLELPRGKWAGAHFGFFCQNLIARPAYCHFCEHCRHRRKSLTHTAYFDSAAPCIQ